MLAAALLGLSLVVNAAFEPNDPSPNAAAKSARAMSAQQKFTVIRPLIRSATDCIVHAVAADPRFGQLVRNDDLNELIVASMTPCADAVRVMIDAHDRLFGEGSGEVFFMGPYLDGLPTTVNTLVNGVGQREPDQADQ